MLALVVCSLPLADVWRLMLVDKRFRRVVQACLATEARGKPNDELDTARSAASALRYLRALPRLRHMVLRNDAADPDEAVTSLVAELFLHQHLASVRWEPSSRYVWLLLWSV